MVKSFDISKLRKSVIKSIPGLTVGFKDPTTWLNTGCYVLNYLISGDFKKGVPLSKVTMFAGESGSGKSVMAAYCMKDALKQGVSVHYIDTEDATTTDWIERVGVDSNDPNFVRIQTNNMKNIIKYVNEVVASYDEAMEGVPEEEQPGLLFVLDSLGGMFSEEEEEKMGSGDFQMTDGMRKAAANAKFINAMLNLMASKKIGMLMTNHVSTSMDQYSDDTISGGKKVIFLSSIIVQITKNKLKEDEFGNKIKDEVGITSSVKVQKTRFTKPFERVYVLIPYNTGINPYSGLFDLFEKKGYLVKEGIKYHYKSLVTGEEKFFLKAKEYGPEQYEFMMDDFSKAEAMGKLEKALGDKLEDPEGESMPDDSADTLVDMINDADIITE